MSGRPITYPPDILIYILPILRRMSGRSIPLLVTEESPLAGQPPKLFVLQRWLPLALDLRPAAGEPDL